MTRTRDSITVHLWRERLREALPAVRAGRDPEAVHVLRGALARLRVWLLLAGDDTLDDDLKSLRDRAAVVRDLDVHLAHKPPPSVREVLVARRHAAQQELVDAVGSTRCGSLVLRLDALWPVKRKAAKKACAKLVRRALRCAKSAKDEPGDVEALHALRRAARRVRFAVEWMGDKAEPLEALQDALGKVGDRAAMLASLRGVEGRGDEVRRYRKKLTRQMREAEAKGRSRWKDARRYLRELA